MLLALMVAWLIALTATQPKVNLAPLQDQVTTLQQEHNAYCNTISPTIPMESELVAIGCL